MSSTIYIAARRQEDAKPVRAAIEAKGYSCNASWIDAAGYGSGIEQGWNLREAAACACVVEVRSADALIIVSEHDGAMCPGGKFVEMGIAIGLKKPIVYLGKKENLFWYYPNIRRCDSIEQVVYELDGILK